MLLQGRSTSKEKMPAYSGRIKGKMHGFYVESLLIVLIIATLVAITLPALKHYNKRTQYRAILDIATPLKSTVEKCLGIKRDPKNCDEESELIVFGGISQHAESTSFLDSVGLILENSQFRLTLTPPQSNSVITYLDENLTLIQTAEIIDRNGRPIIEKWETDPQSGCMLVGLC